MMMSGPQKQNNTDARNEVDLLRSDILDPNGLVLLDRTQGSFEPCQEPNPKRDGEKPPSLLRPAKSAMVNSSMRNRSGKRSSLKQCTVKKTQTIPKLLLLMKHDVGGLQSLNVIAGTNGQRITAARRDTQALNLIMNRFLKMILSMEYMYLTPVES
ncbi:unnamed protein product [Heligmosomoides polygyrus]|uniref:Uncharacterized protein n=1 Tax=Heligmosomoides polygyrus TaxID=6339 RepID=A0A183F6G2_HELPZ|nr:unnamed protein product [Heligmosomoides polygyrus]